MPKLFLLVGPPGVGKSTLALKLESLECIRVSQDCQGKEGHLKVFQAALNKKLDICVDRMGFSKQQRDRYLVPAKAAGYQTEIVVLHESYYNCLERCLNRKDHPTIKTEIDAKNALNTFFSKYERVQDNEADVVTRIWPEGKKPAAICVDIDGTIANVDHRLHFMKGDKKNWTGFFQAMSEDTVNEWCKTLMDRFVNAEFEHTDVILASGRPDNYKKETITWLRKNDIMYDELFMRPRNDSRKDSITKEVILDFEILTRYKPLFFVDDRPSVCRMWRARGFVVLQCQDEEF